MTTKRHAFYGILAMVSLLGPGMTQSARANFIETISQVGTNVVATGSGSVNLTGLTLAGTGALLTGIIPQIGLIQTGPSPSLMAAYFGVTGPTNFGSGGPRVSDTGSGDFFGTQSGLLLVPLFYVSGNALSDSMTFNNETFATLGLTPGTYVWTWGANQNFTLEIGSVPDGGSTVCLLGFALAGLAVVRRKLSC